jgi:PAS domain S-box-containing protein
VLQNVARAQEEIHFQARLLDSVGQAVVATDQHGNVNYWNRSATRLFGWLPEEAKGMSIGRLEVEGAGDGVANALARVADGAPWSGELLAKRKNGSTVPVMVADSPIPGENGTLLGMVRVAADLSPRKHAEDAQRLLADVGSVFAGSFDYEATLRSLARITVPGLADCCIKTVGLRRRKLQRPPALAANIIVLKNPMNANNTPRMVN